MKLYLLSLLLLASQAYSQTSGRDIKSCDKAARMERIVILSSFTAQQMFGVDNASGTYLSSGKKRCFTNEDATATNIVRVSTFAYTLTTTVSTATAAEYTEADNTGYPIPGAWAERCYDWGPNIKSYIRRSVNSVGAAVSGYTCE